MNQLPHIRFDATNRRRLSAAFLLALFLSVFVLTLSEAWHRMAHAEECEPQHQCAVTLLQGGQVETSVTTVTPVVLYLTLVEFVVVEKDFVPSVDFSLPPSCGPPALLS
jgi:hypothetical protein